MESLEIGMSWIASPDIPQYDASGRELVSPNQRVLQPTGSLRAGPSDAIQVGKGTATSTSHMLVTVGRVEISKGENDAHEAEDHVSSGLQRNTSKSSKQRKIKLGIEEDILDRFGPPRQSIRSRIKVEFETLADPLKENISLTSKKANVIERSIMTDPSRAAGDMEKRENDKGRKRTKKSVSGIGKEGEFGMAKKEKKQPLTGIHPSMVLTKDDINADEIIAYPLISLESMDTTGAAVNGNTRTLEQRLKEKKRTGRKIISSKPKQDSDADTPLIQIGSLEDPGPTPVKRGIRSSVFARVMRLVADLPRIEAMPKKTKRLVPEHRPLVWAMVSDRRRLYADDSQDKSSARLCLITERFNLGSISIRGWLSVICWMDSRHRQSSYLA